MVESLSNGLPATLVHMTLPGLGGLSNDDRNGKADQLNLSHATERC